MRISLYYSKKKRYLTGADWIVGSLNYATRRSTGIGNQSQIVLQLAGRLSVDNLRQRIQEFLAKFPAVHGRPARDCLNLAPYWRMKPTGKVGVKPILNIVHNENGGQVQDVLADLERGVNSPLPNERQYLAFHLVTTPENLSYLGMTFDHRLFDAHGAEMFLSLFQRHYENPDEEPNRHHVAPTEQAHLSDWKRKFDSGRETNRTVRAMSRLDLAALPVPRRLRGLPFRFKVLSFDEEQSKRIVETAYSQAGYLLVMPHLLAASIRALHPLFRRKCVSGKDYVVVVSLDTREPASREDKLFFNHVSFLFFRIEAKDAGDHKALVESIKAQMYSQVKSMQPGHFNEANMLMRILPLRVLGFFMRLPFRGMMGSFGFSHVGEADYKSKEFMGLEVLNLFHMPRVTVPPGIGVFFNQFGSRINMVLSYIEGLFEEADADGVFADLSENLTAGSDRTADHGCSV